MRQTSKVLFVYLLILSSSLCAQVYEEDGDSMPADTLYDAEYYSDTGAGSTREYVEPEEIDGSEKNKEDLDSGPYPLHTIFVGPRFGYVYYDEIFNLDDMRELAIMDGFTVGEFIGEPKSTEYGICPGVSFQYRYTGKNVPIFISIPKISFLLGFANTYDGSSVDTYNPGNDTIIVEYTSYKFLKMNYFLDYGFDLGYLFVLKKFQLSLFSGIDGRLWIRDLVERSEVPEGLHVTNYERYGWIYIPLNASFSYQAGNKLSIGVLAGINLMVKGTMLVKIKIRDDYGNSMEADADLLTLKNKTGYHAALLFEPRFSRKIGLKISPYLQFYSFGKSNAGIMDIDGDKSHFYEPASNSFWGGVNINVAVYPQEKKPVFKE